jgi:putative spermidine/putrescine transport system ATP-binding protein
MSALAESQPSIIAPTSPSDAAAGLEIRNLSHSYGGSELSVSDVSFKVPKGEICALLGPSGCGKSTILRAIAGLIRPTAGSIRVADREIGPVPVRRRNIGMVFQNYALFPHMTVAENIAYPLACKSVPRTERRRKATELLALVQLEPFANRLPRELSGGQQQRVAVARALVANPDILLLDEPFGALDRALRFQLQVELLRLQKTLGITTLIVTHDQEEAQSLASHLVLLNSGQIEQAGSPTDIYDRPRSLFANRFMGHVNAMPATALSVSKPTTQLRLDCGLDVVLPRPISFSSGAKVLLTCRPEDLRLVPSPDAGTLQGTVVVAMPLGPTLAVEAHVEGLPPIRISQPRTPDSPIPAVGSRCAIAIDLERCHVFPPESEDQGIPPTASVQT